LWELAEALRDYETISKAAVPLEAISQDDSFVRLLSHGYWTRPNIQDTILRISIGLFGGSTLAIPMSIMATNLSLSLSLYTTWVAASIFGLFLSILSFHFNYEPKDILSGTAAYAAVLVVFVGASLSENNA
jgi:hypothetical protein